MEKYIGPNKWKWVQYNKNNRTSDNKWLDRVLKRRTNFLRVKILDNGEKVVEGTFVYKQNFNEERDYQLFHYYVTENQWITVDLPLATLKHIDTEFLLRQIEKAENAVEGFLIFLGELLNEMLVEIDQFEDALRTLLWDIREKNKTSILDKIFTCRHELLLWKNLLIPITELKMGIEEINLNESCREDIFRCTSKRIDRALVLLNEYEHELDSIINLEEVISSYRGNEIMKTLTVITTAFTPIMAFGALWGMNFKHMPELEWKFGYPLSLLLIGVSTLLLYGYLKAKGWTGDLLKGKKKGSFFK
ncbi:MAG: magnesium transporter CorA family protein [Bacillus sp. (in: Bacteria)]|nr:magnesium transporter CorA family protein [Bacillus sp. (in: firmicutes)]